MTAKLQQREEFAQSARLGDHSSTGGCIERMPLCSCALVFLCSCIVGVPCPWLGVSWIALASLGLCSSAIYTKSS